MQDSIDKNASLRRGMEIKSMSYLGSNAPVAIFMFEAVKQ